MSDVRQEFPAGIFSSPFRPAWWLRNAHAQTVYATLFRKLPDVKRMREEFQLPDGDFLHLDFSFPEKKTPHSPLVMIVHGLSGSSDSHYVRGLQACFHDKGWMSVAINCRGATGPNRKPRAYHAGATEDLLPVLESLGKRFPCSPLAVVGYSLGGNMTLKLLGEIGAHPAVFAGVAVSVPLKLDSCSTRLDQGVSRVYRKRLISELVEQWEAKLLHLESEGLMPPAAPVPARERRQSFRSFWEFDHELMAPLHGFSDVNDYYRRASSFPYLREIRIPTLVIQSSDDPFMGPEVLPTAADLSPSVHFELAVSGGHVGFIAGSRPGRPIYYLEERIPSFLEVCLGGSER